MKISEKYRFLIFYKRDELSFHERERESNKIITETVK